QPLLSESALFAYNLAGRTASVVGHAADTGKAVDIKSLAGKLRPKFQAALLGWYKSGEESHLGVLAETAEKLEQAATTPAVFELWWIVGGVIEGLREGGIQAEVSLKQLLGQVDRQIKRLADQGEADVAEDPAKELVNNLLYYIGRATSSGERIKAIKESFKLGELLPDAIEVEEAREGMSGPNVNLMRTVSGALKEDITRIKDTLDIFVRMAKTDAAELAPLDELLKKVGDTLSVLNLEYLRATLETERARLRSIVERKGVAPDENALMDIASGIVSVETQLDEAMVGLISPESGGIEVDQTEMREVQSAVIRESIINLARVKEAIVEFVNDPSHDAGLKPLPSHIREIQASLRFLHMDRLVALLESLRQYIRVKLLASHSVPAQNELDRMADAIVSIEFYLETVQQSRGNPLSMLDNAEACVATLGFQVGQEYPDDGDEDIGIGSATGTISGVETSIELSGESIVMSGPAELDEESITLEAPPGDEPTQVMDKSIILNAAAAAAAPAPKPPAAPSASGPAIIQSDDVDPEIVEIFLEEAQEVMGALRENFPRWRSNPSDAEALTTVRRSFHTLKGSGRMVGARLIGEFAWSIENMLNRVIDQTVSASDEIFALVERSIAAFPELIEQLEVGTPPKIDVQPLMDTAAAYSRGESVPGSSGDATASAVATPTRAQPKRRAVPTEEATMVSPAGLQLGGTDEPTVIAPRVEVLAPAGHGMDPVLYEIFSREAEGHLAVLAEFNHEAIAGKTEISEELVRALHTLHGSAAMAGAGSIVALLEPLDRYVTELQAQKQPIPGADVPLFGEVHDAARTLLSALADVTPPPSLDKGLLARLRALKVAGATGETENIVMSGSAPSAEPGKPTPTRAKPQKDKPLK
ncbi:MAG: Hpt domain-containing protein, partial [Gammaproteobacteria bacterium]